MIVATFEKIVKTAHKLDDYLMSNTKDIVSSQVNKDRGSLHPINHMKDSIMNL